MTKKEIALSAMKLLKQEHPEPITELIFENEMQLAVAVMLSAQTTDKKVNEITQGVDASGTALRPGLFTKYKTWEDFANADITEITNDIRGVNFHKGKAERLIKAGVVVTNDFKGKLPRTIAQLTTIPGVARKTANVILQELWDITEGIVVDTHVTRVSTRLGLIKDETNAVRIEKELISLIPKEYWRTMSSAIVLHGRYVCKARKPNCASCILRDICPSAFSFD